MIQKTPQHIAFIVDGNRRWATKRHLPAIAGHKLVVDKILDEIVSHSLKLGISHLTFWAFSTENWKRGMDFANKLFGLLGYALDKNTDKYEKAGVRFNTIGDASKLPPKLQQKLIELKNRSLNKHKLTVTVAINYGGRDEIIRAIKKLVKSGKYNQETIDNLTETDFVQFLDTNDLPEPDLIIRTGGDIRLSGFLSWQNQYSELFFTKTLMPDFSTKEFDKILTEYSQRDRRFGGNTKK
ncbi:di-trans,poly-cis-decaprenylcistransferase [Candidatus Beckwithbacteria bacterium CG23_combo_of_CG06-09_8_20_14_all_34_8]|uniref:Isoprenyl transferase n=1 Tax=Candidatus Beckwithbacteria bacterium CG23_combo_of_CG06-09_8_20_14_all_34_8 TaxID=1974497 RepID=A0A2H0B7F0_9BACT|nr:MAG: di-trans,poly-cis-decaprenylcistransferase [Candidatus Beckwithbacteria bacterium CG23_combo_of_CG06-09_8_20_14_all_34_8]